MDKVILKIIIISILLLIGPVCHCLENASDLNYTELYTGNTSFGSIGFVEGTKNALNGDVIVNKIISSNITSKMPNSLDISLNIKMPPKRAILDIVLAMDTSGSMVQLYNDSRTSTYMDWALEIAQVIFKDRPDARVSIVSWDDEDEANDKMTNLTSDNEDIKKELSNLSAECLETDGTIYSIGIKRAVQKLDEEPPSDPYNTSRIIVFVTGRSEFRAEPRNAPKGLTLREQLANASHNRSYGKNVSFNGYQIYPVAIGINDSVGRKWEFANLTYIANYNQTSRMKVYNASNIGELKGVIGEILTELKTKPIANNVQVTDTLYPYLNYLGYSSRLEHGNKSKPTTLYAKVFNNSINNPVTLIWDIGNMSGNDSFIAVIYTRLMLSLPVEVSDRRTQLIYEINNSSPISEVKYRWMTGYDRNFSLPEGRIVISSEKGIDSKNFQNDMKNSMADNPGKMENLKQSPGNNIFSGILGLIIAFLIFKK
jgi:hypothetical protein